MHGAWRMRFFFYFLQRACINEIKQVAGRCNTITVPLGWLKSPCLCPQKYPTYTLNVEVADLAGEGLLGKGKVILTVTDSNDNAPEFQQSKASIVLKIDGVCI